MDFPAWDPVIVELGPIALRWYGLMYVVGFTVGHAILVRLARAGFLELTEEQVSDMILWLVFGVLLGGRLGYAAFYQPSLFSGPQLLALWEGGLSFHGGLLGVVVVAILYSRKTKLHFGRLCDALALAVTPGIFAVRLANFINGELYGRVTDAAAPFAMRFPSDPAAQQLLGLQGLGLRERELRILDSMSETPRAGYDGPAWDAIRDQVPLRHPSQLYEAFGEGLLLGLVLFAVYRLTRRRPLGTGVYAGIFLVGYGTWRFVVENFREPDSHLGVRALGLTRGQQLCAAMIAAGVAVIAWRWRKRPTPTTATAETS